MLEEYGSSAYCFQLPLSAEGSPYLAIDVRFLHDQAIP